MCFFAYLLYWEGKGECVYKFMLVKRILSVMRKLAARV